MSTNSDLPPDNQTLTSGSTDTAVQWPEREERVSQLHALLGEPDPDVLDMADAIRNTAFHYYDEHVMPLVREHWPALLDGSDGQDFGPKLKFLACNLYASAPYTVLFSAANRPWMILAVTNLANALPLPDKVLGLGTRAAMAVLGRLAYKREHRRIILIAAFIATIDHAFDHCMDDEPRLRGKKIHDLLDGTWNPDQPSLQLTRALQVAMSAGLTVSERPPFEAALARVHEWVDSEVAGMTGVPDPKGLGWRLAGVEGTIDGLIFPVYHYAGEGARKWMYDVSHFVQMMDDWIDADEDAATDRNTPVLTGQWDFDAIREQWLVTLDGIEELTRQGGLRAPHYVSYVRRAYVAMIHDVMEAMINGIAA